MARTQPAQPAHRDASASVAIPDDIKRDIAKVVRSMDFQIGTPGGLCLYRAISGWMTLMALGIKAMPVLGGMVYRAGPDPKLDVVAFCGPGSVGRLSPSGLLAHYFIVSGNDLVDFSAGDWQEDTRSVPEVLPSGVASLPPVCWTAPPPDFFWAERSNFTPQIGALSPDLGRAWYTGFADDSSFFNKLIGDVCAQIKPVVVPHIMRCVELYALKERLFAVRNGHTVVRFSQLAKIIGDPALIAQSQQHERLIVLRNKADITPEIARETLVDAGLLS